MFEGGVYKNWCEWEVVIEMGVARLRIGVWEEWAEDGAEA